MDSPLLVALVAGLTGGVLVGYLLAYQWFQGRVERAARIALAAKQNAFIAIASHYLLTPISIIQSAITRLTEKSGLELAERQRLYAAIETGERRLFIIAEQMLIAIKLIHGELDLAPKVGHLHDPIFEAIKEVTVIAQMKKATFQTNIPQNPPLEASFDARQLKTAVVALLDNAIKFSPERGQILITLKRDGAVARLAVTDSGIGLTAEQLSHATEKFYRGTPPYTYDYEGMGLGLHIAYVIMAAHGGDVEIKSAGPGRGATATLVLPLN